MGKVKASALLVRVLEQWGVQRVYGLPGDSIDTTVAALRDERSKIKFIQVRHEEVGSLAAASEAKLTKKVGVCLSIGGPGAIHLLNGLYDAQMDHNPVLALVGQVSSRFLNDGYFQEIDSKAMFDKVGVYNKIVQSAESIPRLIDEAIRAAYEFQGPAILTIPDNYPDVMIEDTFKAYGETLAISQPKIAEDTLEKSLALINKAHKPVILSGHGSYDASEELMTFIEKLSIPIVQTMPSKGTVADDHPNALGSVGKLGTKPAYEAMHEADLLIMLGTNYPYTEYLPKNVPCIQVDTSLTRLGSRYNVTIPVHGTVKEFLTWLNQHAEPVKNRPFLAACQTNMKQWRQWMAEETGNQQSAPIHPAAVMSAITDISTPDTVYSIDVGTATSWGARFINVQPKQDYLISAWLGTMGCALPGAIAAKAAEPNRQAIAVCGDGAFAMVMQDFVTAVKYELPMIVVVLNNQKLSFIEYEQQSAGQLNYAIDLHDIDFASFAKACGGEGINVQTFEELAPAFAKAKVSKVPILLNIYVADDAPLPGKIVMDEAKGYGRFEIKSVLKDHSFSKLPPLKEIMRQFL